jgi:hypothetical protein
MWIGVDERIIFFPCSVRPPKTPASPADAPCRWIGSGPAAGADARLDGQVVDLENFVVNLKKFFIYTVVQNNAINPMY